MNNLKKMAVAGLILTTGFSAVASSNGLYLGGELQANRFKVADTFKTLKKVDGSNLFDKSSGGIGALVGYKFDNNFGVEGGYTFLKRYNEQLDVRFNNATIGVQGHQTQSNMYVDGAYFHPLNDQFDLKGTVGLGRLRTKLRYSGSALAESVGGRSAKIGVRAGFGVQYSFNDNVKAHAMARFQKGNNALKNMKTLGVGMTYMFS